MNSARKGTKGKRVIIYTRVSTTDQKDNGYSLQAQEERLRSYCKLQGFTVVEHFQDDASAKTFDRPAFNRLLEYLKAHKSDVDILLFVKWDRFSRSAEESYRMIRLLADIGIEAQAVEQPIDLSIPENKLMLAFYLAAPEVENDRRSLNTIAGMRRAMREGRWVNKAPLGYKAARDEANHPCIVPSESAPFVREAFRELAKAVYTQEEIRLSLRRKGLNCSKNQFSLMLRNPLYMGKIHIPAWRGEPQEDVQGLHEALVSEELFNKVQDVLEARKRGNRGNPNKRHEDLPLRGNLTCSRCGGNLTGSVIRGNGGQYYYYHCQHGCKERFRADKANEAFVTYLQTLTVPPEIAELYLAVMEDIFVEKEGDRDEQLAKIDMELREIDARLLKIDERFIDGDLDRAAYQRLKESNGEKRQAIERRKAELESIDTNFMRYARYGFGLVTHLPQCYREASLPVKQKLLGLIFPEKLTYDNGKYQTTRLNEVIAVLRGNHDGLAVNEKGLTAMTTISPIRLRE